jgi:hypothetical protein
MFHSSYLVGSSFAYRCLSPRSGVSPIMPVLLLLFGWYLWGLLQTRRLRFSENGRPWLPGDSKDELDARFYVSDNDLKNCRNPRNSCLYKNITCLFITREVAHRFWRFRFGGGASVLASEQEEALDKTGRGYTVIDIALFFLYFTLLFWFSLFTPIRSLDHFLWYTPAHLSAPYEFLVVVLFFPLILISLAGWLRLILIWGAFKRGLLDRLESLPIRFAFSRLTPIGWMSMLRQGGLQEQWRDMARSVESMRQIVHQPDLTRRVSISDWQELTDVNKSLQGKIKEIRAQFAAGLAAKAPLQERGYHFVKNIEQTFAAFGQKLLSSTLIPYWKDERTGLVESWEIDELPVKSQEHAGKLSHPMELHAGPASEEPALVLAAEEFIAIRYVSLIRAVLVNIRYLMIFISASFALAIVAWNSYPFQPRQQVDWIFTGLLVFLGLGVLWVFAQMYRDPILSRITDTKANELGWEFWLRIISFGAVPVMAWLAYQFPDVGSTIYKFVEPAIPVIK